MLTPTPLELPVTIDAPGPPQLWIIEDVRGPADAVRDIHVATPPGYAVGNTRYPVVFMQDGQNLFDPTLSFAGHWGLLETLTVAPNPPIIVGIPNLGHERLREYSPFDDVVHGEGEGAEYLEFLQTVVKPLVDRHFRTSPGRETTAVAGSSMGGLFALYALVAGAGTFGSAWVMSPALWYADGAMYEWLARQPAPIGRVWLDVGVEEGPEEVADVRRMRDLLVTRGWRLGDTLRYLEDDAGDHDEASWGRRIREHWIQLIGMLSASPRAFPRSRDLP